ncbi:RND family efflux transporter MFP subunit [Lachnotalea glycerini]|uniref:RND family efflux transporter MFP subunit n=1 Tax=Lachnotalea glycerini TaxID=1763509 RepID=A0A318ELQ1_9FIRM|nr:efflux RND transporter periplasmic adaptor subunit [Lachnotalea glycerini]PXV85684.1 RND family efflux transporter MFP subunit [Lachnotalea glycerini]
MKRKKDILKGLTVVAACVLLIAVYVVVSNKPLKLMTETTTKGSIQEVVDVNGDIESENTKVYYSKVTATVEQLTIKKGDSVKAGDQLVLYDTKDLETSVEQAKLGTKASMESYQSSLNNNAKNNTNYANATTSLGILEQQIADEKSYISSIQESLTSANEIASEITAVTSQMASTTDSKALKKLQNKLDSLNCDYDSYDVSSLTGDLAYHQTELSQCLTSQSEYKAQQKTADASLIDSAAKDQLKTVGESAQLSQSQAEEELSKANQGIVAEFDGIITGLDIEAGSYVPEGSRLLVLESSNELKVVVNVSKYDIGKIELGQKAVASVAGNEYEGSVSKISRVADTDTSDKPQVSVEIHINNPDDKIYIGLEADVDIYTEEKNDIVTVSSTAVYSDDDGNYCYTIENGLVTKKYFTKGIESDSLVELTDGIAEGEIVITDSITDDSVGRKASAMKH